VGCVQQCSWLATCGGIAKQQNSWLGTSANTHYLLDRAQQGVCLYKQYSLQQHHHTMQAYTHITSHLYKRHNQPSAVPLLLPSAWNKGHKQNTRH
jgi:hypothetical protein